MIKSRPNPQEPRSQWSVILISSYLSHWVQIRASLLFILLGSLRRVHYILYTSHVKCWSAITISCQIDQQESVTERNGFVQGEKEKQRIYTKSKKNQNNSQSSVVVNKKCCYYCINTFEFDDLNSQLTGPTRHVSTWQEKHTGSE